MGWLTGWSYAVALTISNPNQVELTDFQVKVSLDSTFVGWANVNADGSDIRITDSDGVTLLPIWIENFDTTNTVATIWVKVPSIPAATVDAAGNTVDGTVTLYLYYGNSTATSVSDGDATFDFFDDFAGTALDTTKWTNVDTGTVAVNDGLTLTGTGTNRAMIRSNVEFAGFDPSSSVGGVVEISVMFGDATYSAVQLYANWDGTQGVASYDRPGNVSFATIFQGGSIVEIVDGTATSLVNTTTAVTDIGTDYQILSLKSCSGTYYADLNYGSWLSASAAATSFATHYVGVASRELSYSTYVKWFRVRKYAATEPTATAGTIAITPPVDQSCSDATTTGDFSIRGISTGVTDSVTDGDGLVLGAGSVESDATTVSDTTVPTLVLWYKLSDAVSELDSLKRDIGYWLGDSTTLVEKLSKYIPKPPFADATTTGDSIANAVYHITFQYLSDVVTLVETKKIFLMKGFVDKLLEDDSYWNLAGKVGRDIVLGNNEDIKGLYFNGLNSYGNWANYPSLADALSVFVWFYSLPDYGLGGDIVRVGAGANDFYIRTKYNSLQFSLGLDDNGSVYRILKSVYQYGFRKYDVAGIVFNSGEVRMYDAGSIIYSDVLPYLQVYTGSTQFWIGGVGLTESYRGAIYRVMLWNRSLSDTEVQALYSNPDNPPTDGLILWLDGDSIDWENGVWLDKSGNGNDATLVNVGLVTNEMFKDYVTDKVDDITLLDVGEKGVVKPPFVEGVTLSDSRLIVVDYQLFEHVLLHDTSPKEFITEIDSDGVSLSDSVLPKQTLYELLEDVITLSERLNRVVGKRETDLSHTEDVFVKRVELYRIFEELQRVLDVASKTPIWDVEDAVILEDISSEAWLIIKRIVYLTSKVTDEIWLESKITTDLYLELNGND